MFAETCLPSGDQHPTLDTVGNSSVYICKSSEKQRRNARLLKIPGPDEYVCVHKGLILGIARGFVLYNRHEKFKRLQRNVKWNDRE